VDINFVALSKKLAPPVETTSFTKFFPAITPGLLVILLILAQSLTCSS
jgi:hypothetical protein